MGQHKEKEITAQQAVAVLQGRQCLCGMEKKGFYKGRP